MVTENFHLQKFREQLAQELGYEYLPPPGAANFTAALTKLLPPGRDATL